MSTPADTSPRRRPSSVAQNTGPSRLLSAKRGAEYVGIPYTTLRELAFRGEIAVVKLGKSWWFTRADLDRLIESHKQQVG